MAESIDQQLAGKLMPRALFQSPGTGAHVLGGTTTVMLPPPQLLPSYNVIDGGGQAASSTLLQLQPSHSAGGASKSPA